MCPSAEYMVWYVIIFTVFPTKHKTSTNAPGKTFIKHTCVILDSCATLHKLFMLMAKL